MKKRLSVPASLLFAWASAAHAQSSVTLYGLIDAGIMYTNNVASGSAHGPLWQATSGEINGSRFGVRGQEDLGGGVNSFFDLENGFNVTNGKLGQDNRLFGRSAFVGIGDISTGSISLGRQYDSIVDYLRPLTAQADTFGSTGFAHPFDNDNLVHSFAFNNAVKYASPDLSGLSFGGAYALSNTTEFAANRAYSAGARYVNGPLAVAAGYLQISGSNSANTAGAVDTAESSYEAKAGFQLGAQTQRTFGGAANYDLGAARLGLAYTQSAFEGSDSFGSAGGTVRFNNYEANALFFVTQRVSVGLTYTYTDGSVSDTTTYGTDPHWQSADFQTVYTLSKHTDVYFESMFQKVSGHHYVAFIDGAGGPSSTQTQVAATIGMRTRF
ncbi:porin [Paraburkholderia acidipaludis]|uniref:porin n=1 Tax=Paraburkholderia acidipaludis TaxID=660537 RepID=UPI0005BC2C58|nr:porin [Paraburkholderia acidipaludis]